MNLSGWNSSGFANSLGSLYIDHTHIPTTVYNSPCQNELYFRRFSYRPVAHTFWGTGMPQIMLLPPEIWREGTPVCGYSLRASSVQATRYGRRLLIASNETSSCDLNEERTSCFNFSSLSGFSRRNEVTAVRTPAVVSLPAPMKTVA